MSQSDLDRINKELFNAHMGLDKFGENSAQGARFKNQIAQLEAEKNQLPTPLLHAEQLEKARQKIINHAQHVARKPNDPDRVARFEEQHQELIDLGMSDAEIQDLIAEAEQATRRQYIEDLLNTLTRQTKLYFLATYTETGMRPTDLTDDLVGWREEERATLPKTQRAILNTIDRLRDLDVSAAHLETALQAGLKMSTAARRKALNALRLKVDRYAKKRKSRQQFVPEMIDLLMTWPDKRATVPHDATLEQAGNQRNELEAYGVPAADIAAAIRAGETGKRPATGPLNPLVSRLKRFVKGD